MCVCVCVCVSSNGSCRSVVILYIHAAHGSFWFGWSFTRVYASRAFLWLQLCFFLQCWIHILQVRYKVLTLVLTYINAGCIAVQSHEPSDLPQLCDDTLSESYCLTPQKQTAAIVTDFVECSCHQSSKPTISRQANIRCRDQIYI